MSSSTNQKVSSLFALQALAEREGYAFWDLLNEVFDSLPQGTIVTDNSGLVVIFNKAAETILGFEAKDIIGKRSLWDVFEPPQWLRENLLLNQAFAQEEIKTFSRNGKHISLNIKPFVHGETKNLQGTLTLLSEYELVKPECKGLVNLAAVGRIISAMAHEINNPLQAIRTSLELSLDNRKSQARRQEYLQTAETEVSRISRLITQMRNFYRPIPGKSQPSDVHVVLHEALYKLSNKNEVEIKLNLTPNLPKISLIDYQLQQVFINLISSILETAPQNGQLQIESSWGENNMIAVSFKNNVSQANWHWTANLFDPFATVGQVAELALGLSVSYEIIREIGGSIELNPNNLTIHLPYDLTNS